MIFRGQKRKSTPLPPNITCGENSSPRGFRNQPTVRELILHFNQAIVTQYLDAHFRLELVSNICQGLVHFLEFGKFVSRLIAFPAEQVWSSI